MNTFRSEKHKIFEKNRSLPAVLFWQISATICICLLISFFFSSFDQRAFWKVATVACDLIDVWYMLVLKPSEFVYFNCTNAANEELCEVLYEGSFQV